MSDPNPEAAGAYIRLPKPKSAGWGGKALLVCLLAMLMAIPGLFVLGLVHDRANRSEKVVAEVSDMRGGAQQVLGPLIVLAALTARRGVYGYLLDWDAWRIRQQRDSNKAPR